MSSSSELSKNYSKWFESQSSLVQHRLKVAGKVNNNVSQFGATVATHQHTFFDVEKSETPTNPTDPACN